MGQGTYYAVGYGVILNKKLEKLEEDDFDRVEDAREGLGVRVSYESRSPYWAIFIHEGANEYLPPTQKLKDFAKVKVPEAVKNRWARFCKRLGLKLKPEILWIADYD